jgi:hypothetical protein
LQVWKRRRPSSSSCALLLKRSDSFAKTHSGQRCKEERSPQKTRLCSVAPLRGPVYLCKRGGNARRLGHCAATTPHLGDGGANNTFPFGRQFHARTERPNICQDRLGTNIWETLRQKGARRFLLQAFARKLCQGIDFLGAKNASF